jgi:HK97 family phage major capsid protein
MELKQWEIVLDQAEEKAKAATAIWADNPDEAAEATADDLMAQAEKLEARADKMKAAANIEAKAETAKAARLALENAPATNDNGGYATTESLVPVKTENDTPYKSLGELLMDVCDAAQGMTSEKLAPLRSKDKLDEGGFSVGKALGGPFVGNLFQQAVRRGKAISGMSESVPQDGGILVGEDRQDGIMGRVYDVGQLLQRADMTPISGTSNSMVFFREKETSRATGSRRGGIRFYWASEGDEKTSSKPGFERQRLELHKAIGLVYATDELLADAPALSAWIMKNLPEELRFGIEDAMINGTGVGMPRGVVGANCTVSVAKETGQAADTIVAENVMKMWSRRWTRSTDYVWLVNQDTGPQLWQMSLAVGTGGALVYLPPGGLSGLPYATLYGQPVVEVEYCATVGTVGDIILASFDEYQMIEKGGMQSASSIHVRFIYDEQVFRFVTRVDGQPKWAAPLTPFKGTNTVSPFVTLASRD